MGSTHEYEPINPVWFRRVSTGNIERLTAIDDGPAGHVVIVAFRAPGGKTSWRTRSDKPTTFAEAVRLAEKIYQNACSITGQKP